LTPEELHRALDGMTADDAQQIRVTSVVIAQERRWIQIELIGPRHYSLLLSADLRRDPEMIRAALQSWMTGDWTAEIAAVSGVMIHNATIRLGAVLDDNGRQTRRG
jgi:hypothetical protein